MTTVRDAWVLAPSSAPENPLERTLTDLLERCAEGDDAAMARFYQLSSPVILAFLRRRTSTVADAEAVLADTYVEVWRRAPGLSWRGRAPLAWVARIAFELA